jgi:hypothetical protein
MSPGSRLWAAFAERPDDSMSTRHEVNWHRAWSRYPIMEDHCPEFEG